MIKKYFKFLAPIVATAVVGMTVISVGQEQQLGYKTTLDVWSGAVKINYDSQDMTNQLNPIVINGSTYLPLRSAATLFGKSITWNDATKTAVVKDNPNSTIGSLQNQITLKDAEIDRLEEELEDLRNGGDMDGLEDDLNDDYEEYEDVDFEISLSGDEDDIEVTIETDEDDWDDLSSDDQEDFLQDIVDDILDEFEDADIEGEIEDGSDTIDEFSVDSHDDVEMESGGDRDDLEDELNDDLEDDEFGELEDIDNDDLDIELYGDEEDIDFYINIDLDDYDDEWEDLVDDDDGEDDIKDFLEEVYEAIQDDNDFEDADIDGYFYDTDDDDELVRVRESNGDLKYSFYK